jgi:hypothetical protein
MDHGANSLRAIGAQPGLPATVRPRRPSLPHELQEDWEAPDLAPEFAAAQRALDELTAARLELHFEVGAGNRVRVQVRSADGEVVREIPAARLFEAISGGGGLLIDGKA